MAIQSHQGVTFFHSVWNLLIGFDSASDSTSLASQMTSTDSGIWSENGATPTKVMGTEPVFHRAPEVNGTRTKSMTPKVRVLCFYN